MDISGWTLINKLKNLYCFVSIFNKDEKIIEIRIHHHSSNSCMNVVNFWFYVVEKIWNELESIGIDSNKQIMDIPDDSYRFQAVYGCWGVMNENSVEFLYEFWEFTCEWWIHENSVWYHSYTYSGYEN